jgi:tRNA A-37 threonylcarbamoyl transferase component Bud32
MVVATPDHVTREQMNEALVAQNEFISSCIAIDRKWKQFEKDCEDIGIDIHTMVEVINGRSASIHDGLEQTADGNSESAESTDPGLKSVDELHIRRVSL